MSRHEQILDRMRDTNPVPQLEVINESDLTSLTSLLDERRSVMTDLKKPVRKERHDRIPERRLWTRPIVAFGAALVLVLGVVGLVAFVLPGESGDVANQPVAPTAAPAPVPRRRRRAAATRSVVGGSW